jgi:hypothetical protein
MIMDNSDLLLLKSELTNDPLNLGLTTAVEDDEANANLLNEVRSTILVYRASVPSDEINIPIDEYNAASAGQQGWWSMQTADGSIKPSVIQPEFYKMFGSGTAARASFDSVTKEPTSRAIQLFGGYVNLTPSDIANARAAT